MLRSNCVLLSENYLNYLKVCKMTLPFLQTFAAERHFLYLQAFSLGARSVSKAPAVGERQRQSRRNSLNCLRYKCLLHWHICSSGADCCPAKARRLLLLKRWTNLVTVGVNCQDGYSPEYTQRRSKFLGHQQRLSSYHHSGLE